MLEEKTTIVYNEANDALSALERNSGDCVLDNLIARIEDAESLNELAMLKSESLGQYFSAKDLMKEAVTDPNILPGFTEAEELFSFYQSKLDDEKEKMNREFNELCKKYSSLFSKDKDKCRRRIEEIGREFIRLEETIGTEGVSRHIIDYTGFIKETDDICSSIESLSEDYQSAEIEDKKSLKRFEKNITEIEKRYESAVRRYSHVPVITPNEHISDDKTKEMIRNFRDDLKDHQKDFWNITRQKNEIRKVIQWVEKQAEIISVSDDPSELMSDEYLKNLNESIERRGEGYFSKVNWDKPYLKKCLGEYHSKNDKFQRLLESKTKEAKELLKKEKQKTEDLPEMDSVYDIIDSLPAIEERIGQAKELSEKFSILGIEEEADSSRSLADLLQEKKDKADDYINDLRSKMQYVRSGFRSDGPEAPNLLEKRKKALEYVEEEAKKIGGSIDGLTQEDIETAESILDGREIKVEYGHLNREMDDLERRMGEHQEKNPKTMTGVEVIGGIMGVVSIIEGLLDIVSLYQRIRDRVSNHSAELFTASDHDPDSGFQERNGQLNDSIEKVIDSYISGAQEKYHLMNNELEKAVGKGRNEKAFSLRSQIKTLDQKYNTLIQRAADLGIDRSYKSIDEVKEEMDRVAEMRQEQPQKTVVYKGARKGSGKSPAQKTPDYISKSHVEDLMARTREQSPAEPNRGSYLYDLEPLSELEPETKKYREIGDVLLGNPTPHMPSRGSLGERLNYVAEKVDSYPPLNSKQDLNYFRAVASVMMDSMSGNNGGDDGGGGDDGKGGLLARTADQKEAKKALNSVLYLIDRSERGREG
ncbi:MAG: hypothetical protein R6U32_01275 [Candidatus Woesearchaeota archaeon]